MIVACKNEERNIKNLITALENQTYDKDYYEVILVDDDSIDSTAKTIKDCIYSLPNFFYLKTMPAYQREIGKKKAISTGVAESRGEILAFTDADCLPAPDWLRDIDSAITDKVDFYAGYSELLHPKKNLFSALKNLERAAIFAVCAGSFGLNIPITCTARNIAYRKDIWLQTKGYEGIGHIPSGDDDLMLLKSRNFIRSYFFSFCQTAKVDSIENNNFDQNLNQETRRASKLRHYPLYVKLLILFVAFYFCFLVYNIVFFNFDSYFFAGVGLKVALEFLLLSVFLGCVKRLKYLLVFPLIELLYIPFFLFIGCKGTFGRYVWKS